MFDIQPSDAIAIAITALQPIVSVPVLAWFTMLKELLQYFAAWTSSTLTSLPY